MVLISYPGSLNTSKLYLLASRYYYQKLLEKGKSGEAFPLCCSKSKYCVVSSCTPPDMHIGAHGRCTLLFSTYLGNDFLGASFFLGAICQVSSLSKHYTHTQTHNPPLTLALHITASGYGKWEVTSNKKREDAGCLTAQFIATNLLLQ